MEKSRKQHADSAALRRGMERCFSQLTPFVGTMCRAVATKYASSGDLLTGAGAKMYGGRWNPPGEFCAVYGTLDPYAALAETVGTYGQYNLPFEQRLPLVLVAIHVQLLRVLDLTDGRIRQHLGVSEERMLTGDWQATQARNEEALTQALGRLAWEAKIEALLVPSARLKREKNLVIFPDQLSKSSRLRIVNQQDLPEPRA